MHIIRIVDYVLSINKSEGKGLTFIFQNPQVIETFVHVLHVEKTGCQRHPQGGKSEKSDACLLVDRIYMVEHVEDE